MTVIQTITGHRLQTLDPFSSPLSDLQSQGGLIQEKPDNAIKAEPGESPWFCTLVLRRPGHVNTEDPRRVERPIRVSQQLSGKENHVRLAGR